MRRGLGLSAFSLMALMGASAFAQFDPAADAAIARSRATMATYSVFTWNEAETADRGRVSEWSAEFHHGQFHRVENPLNRMIADCVKLTGTWFNVATGEYHSGPRVAKAACGIEANTSVISTRMIGSVRGRFGKVDRVELINKDGGVRTYDIDKDGALVAGTYRSEDGRLHLEAKAMARLKKVDSDIFSVESLATSAVPDRYKKKAGTRSD